MEGGLGDSHGDFARRLVLTARILCVDTWLGSYRVLCTDPESRRQLHLKHGFPQQHFQFLANGVLSKRQNTMFPLPTTSYSATDTLARVGLRFDVIYIDTHDDESEVSSDLTRCFELLRPGGTMFRRRLRR